MGKCVLVNGSYILAMSRHIRSVTYEANKGLYDAFPLLSPTPYWEGTVLKRTVPSIQCVFIAKSFESHRLPPMKKCD